MFRVSTLVFRMLGMIMTVVAIMITSPNSSIGHPEGCGNQRTCSVSSDTDHGPEDLEWRLTNFPLSYLQPLRSQSL
jgi:hypothetical protein